MSIKQSVNGRAVREPTGTPAPAAGPVAVGSGKAYALHLARRASPVRSV